jgi:urea transport system substrate-binding protein
VAKPVPAKRASGTFLATVSAGRREQRPIPQKLLDAPAVGVAMKIGLLVSRSGPAGMWAPSCDAGAMLAAAEINSAGGILDREVDLFIADSGWSETEAVMAAEDLVDIEGVDAVVGMHPSNVRDAVKRGLSTRVPYIYTPQYEGGERSPCTLTTGATDEEMLAPAICWLTEQRRTQRFFFVGNDYVWPCMAYESAGAMIRAAGGKIVGAAFLPIGIEDHSAILERIRAARPDAIVMVLLGTEAARFNRAFSQAGLASGILRLGLGIDETVLYAIGSAHSENLFAVLAYFSQVHSAANDRFLEIYHACFGDDAPPVNIACQSCYDGVHVAANLARSLGRYDAAALARSVRRPAGREAVRSRLEWSPIGSTPRAHLAAADGIEFRVVAIR